MLSLVRRMEKKQFASETYAGMTDRAVCGCLLKNFRLETTGCAPVSPLSTLPVSSSASNVHKSRGGHKKEELPPVLSNSFLNFIDTEIPAVSD